MDTFLGKPFRYWMELQQRVNELNYEKLMDDIVILSAKVSFYESRIKELSEFKIYLEKK